MFHIEIDEPYQEKINQQLIQQAVSLTLKLEKQPTNTGLSIVISDDEQLHHLNRQFRAIDAPTDVLSFPADELDPQSGERYIGDVIISYERAQENCLSFENEAIVSSIQTIQAEILLLTVHGVLHLLGYDHTDEEEKAHMWERQTAILSEFGAGLMRNSLL